MCRRIDAILDGTMLLFGGAVYAVRWMKNGSMRIDIKSCFVYAVNQSEAERLLLEMYAPAFRGVPKDEININISAIDPAILEEPA